MSDIAVDSKTCRTPLLRVSAYSALMASTSPAGRGPRRRGDTRETAMANIQKSTDSSSLAEVVSIILDKGIVIDAWATVSLVGIQILCVEARVVIASVETYLKYAEAMGLTGG